MTEARRDWGREQQKRGTKKKGGRQRVFEENKKGETETRGVGIRERKPQEWWARLKLKGKNRGRSAATEKNGRKESSELWSSEKSKL